MQLRQLGFPSSSLITSISSRKCVSLLRCTPPSLPPTPPLLSSMNSLLKTLRNVVELGEEESPGAFAPSQRDSVDEQSNPEVLRQHISTLTQKLARQVKSYEELRGESISMEKELTRVRLRFAAARKLWESTNNSLELSIQNLVEHRLFGAASAAPARPSTAFGSSSDKVSPNPADTPLLDAIYVASLREQIQRLKEMVMRSDEERSQLQSEKQYEEMQRVLHASGFTTSHLDAQVRAAVQKLVAHWGNERAYYESVIESLEQNAAKHAEREALLSDCVKQEQERRAEATAQNSAAESEELRRLREELEQWKRGRRTVMESTSGDSHRFSQTASPISANATQQPVNEDVSDASPLPYVAKDRHFLVSLESAGAHNVTGAPLQGDAALGLVVGDRVLAEKLERLSRDCSARDEALDNLYRDNRSLQEAVQHAESRTRACEAELQHCQEKMEELAEQLSCEQHRTRQLEDEKRLSAVSEEKLREQIMQLRQAVKTAAVGQTPLVAPNGLSTGVSITHAAPVHVRLPLNASILEHSVPYEKAATWRDCAREAARWWKELRLNAAPPRSSQVCNAMSTAHARGSGVLRRGPRAPLMLGGIFAILMFIYMLFLFVDSARAARRARDMA
ncbi:conserved hypothetical protein [Leishmania infantum JPCM5]|uniref:Uncharacterized protein n=2 Tax=Leishmania infantum TaxID=5671 RepID=A4I7S1_LEIIN|nr:conserved hypothetical protein [Leishmania infantum JPCM5]CAC9524101.1 hypothetical_protein_-_conserved [Leishmania infantum]CAM70857.1 conserved hypothetical protein [Leishmania infantum JPCM5]SUZ44675.1 hypothetical_protein_-_conserved [Leishmania infantum]|eukprot:XP_001467790.1 conserved hypothetical protein [Leishmania infantum JPCM5]